MDVESWILQTPLPKSLQNLGKVPEIQKVFPGNSAPVKSSLLTPAEQKVAKEMEEDAKNSGFGGWVRPVYLPGGPKSIGGSIVIDRIVTQDELTAMLQKKDSESGESEDYGLDVPDVASEVAEMSDSDSEYELNIPNIPSDSDDEPLLALVPNNHPLEEESDDDVDLMGLKIVEAPARIVDYLQTQADKSKLIEKAIDSHESNSISDGLSDLDYMSGLKNDEISNPNESQLTNAPALPETITKPHSDMAINLPKDPVIDQNEIRSAIYTTYLPQASNLKSNPAESFAAIQKILGIIYQLTSYPSDQVTLSQTLMSYLHQFQSPTSPITPLAQYYLAKIYIDGIPKIPSHSLIYTSLDIQIPAYKASFPLLTSSARKNHAESVYALAQHFHYGWGCPINHSRAVYLYTKASRKNHPGALYKLAKAHETGEISLPISLKEYVKYLKLSYTFANQTYPESCLDLYYLYANGYEGIVYPDLEYAVEVLSRGMELRYNECEYILAHVFIEGHHNFGIDKKRGIELLIRAAKNKHLEAMFELSGYYLVGVVVEEEVVIEQADGEALYWLREAAEGGHVKSQYAYGYVIEHGLTEMNKSTSELWYKRAAANGHEKAIEVLKSRGEYDKKVGVRYVMRHVLVDEELDGGSKCALM